MKQLEVLIKKGGSNQGNHPIIFIHGACHDSHCWNEYFLDYFVKHNFETYALTLTGRGLSKNGTLLHSAGIEQFILDVKSISGKFNLPPILIGHSMGGFIAQKYAQKNKVAGIVLMNSVPPNGILSILFKLFISHPLKFIKAICTFNLGPFICNSKISTQLFLSDNVEQKVKDNFTKMLHNESFKALFDMSFKPITNLVNNNSQPTLVLGSECDNIIPKRLIFKTAEYYNNSTCEIFEKMGHDMMLENKWKNVADYIIDWMSNNCKSNSGVK